MKPDWKDWCRGPGVHHEDDEVEVAIGKDRRQRVRVDEREDELVLTSKAARAGQVRDLEALSLRLWERNRHSMLVSSRIDMRGGVISETVLPFAGLTQEEFHRALQHLAVEADRLEFLLTGSDEQ